MESKSDEEEYFLPQIPVIETRKSLKYESRAWFDDHKDEPSLPEISTAQSLEIPTEFGPINNSMMQSTGSFNTYASPGPSWLLSKEKSQNGSTIGYENSLWSQTGGSDSLYHQERKASMVPIPLMKKVKIKDRSGSQVGFGKWSEWDDSKAFQTALKAMRRRSRPVIRPAGYVHLERSPAPFEEIESPDVHCWEHLIALQKLSERSVRRKLHDYLSVIKRFFNIRGDLVYGLVPLSSLLRFLRTIRSVPMPDGTTYVVSDYTKAPSRVRKILESPTMSRIVTHVLSLSEIERVGLHYCPERLHARDEAQINNNNRFLTELERVVVGTEDFTLCFADFLASFGPEKNDELIQETLKMTAQDVQERISGGRHLGCSEVYVNRTVQLWETNNSLSLAGLVDEFYNRAAIKAQTFARIVVAKRLFRTIKAALMRKRNLEKALRDRLLRVQAYAELRRTQRDSCTRPFRKWNKMTKDSIRHHEIFRGTFWPVYIWRRRTLWHINAKRKAFFLKEVLDTTVKMRFMRAWFKEAHHRAKITRKIEKARRREPLMREIIQAWHKIAKRNAIIEQRWSKGGGLQLRRKNLRKHLGRPMVLWRYWTVGAKIIEKNKCRFVFPESLHPKNGNELTPSERHEILTEKVKEAITLILPVETYAWAPTTNPMLLSDCDQVTTLLQAEMTHRIQECRTHFSYITPKVLNGWRLYVENCKKNRFAFWYGGRYLKTKVFKKWKMAQRSGLLKQMIVDEEKAKIAEREARLAEVKRRQYEKVTLKGAELKEKWKNDQLKRVEQSKKIVDENKIIDVQIQESKLRYAAKQQRDEKFMELLEKQNDLADKILVENSNEEVTIDEDDIKETAANIRSEKAGQLVDILGGVMAQIENQQCQRLLKMCFQQFKVLLVAKRSIKMMTVNKLQKWIKIANRHRQLYNSMPRYHDLKTKWKIFNVWLRFIHNRVTTESPELGEQIRNRRSLAIGFARWLSTNAKLGFNENSTPSNRRQSMVVIPSAPIIIPEEDEPKQQTQDDSGVMTIKPPTVSVQRRNTISIPSTQSNKLSMEDAKATLDALKAESDRENGLEEINMFPKPGIPPSGPGGLGSSSILAVALAGIRKRHLQLEYGRKDHRIYRPPASSIQVPFGQFQRGIINSEIQPVFYRWAEYVQAKKVRRELVELNLKRRKLQTAARVLCVLRWSVTPKYVSPMNELIGGSFVYKRVLADIDRWRSEILVPMSQCVSIVVRKRNRNMLTNMDKRRNENQPLLHPKLQAHAKMVDSRLELERRLLARAFEKRAVWKFQDVEGLSVGNCGSTKFTHKDVDPGQHAKVHSITVNVSGALVCGLSMVIQHNAGLLIRTPLSGSSSGHPQTFDLKDDEHLIGVECSYQSTIRALRFHCNSGRASSWFGVPMSTSATGSIQCKYEAGYESIIGFWGYETSKGLEGLGPVIRRLDPSSSVFAGCWLRSVDHPGNPCDPEALAVARTEFSQILRMRTVEVYEVCWLFFCFFIIFKSNYSMSVRSSIIFSFC
eukprot:TRINITY_DN165140_c0_g2_i4.p1 TRINITY_DN165140_c0_g2~~TRINITY_DN165140_c0_g2_i4.p1  ORF type:complete len:1511 (+),score=381.74 TRINITY_DN165140_c0_g2_i4:152-4684(+)